MLGQITTTHVLNRFPSPQLLMDMTQSARVTDSFNLLPRLNDTREIGRNAPRALLKTTHDSPFCSDLQTPVSIWHLIFIRSQR